MQVTLTDFGARVVGVFLPVEEGGGLRNVSLAAKSDEDYRKTDLYPGSTIIPVAGRISGAQAEIKEPVISSQKMSQVVPCMVELTRQMNNTGMLLLTMRKIK